MAETVIGRRGFLGAACVAAGTMAFGLPRAARSRPPLPSLDEALGRLDLEALLRLVGEGMGDRNDGHFWVGRTMVMCRAAFRPLVHDRDVRGIPFGLADLRRSITVGDLQARTSDGDLPLDVRRACETWLTTLPGYRSRPDSAHTGRQTALDQHGYVAMGAERVFDLLACGGPDTGERVLAGSVPWDEMRTRWEHRGLIARQALPDAAAGRGGTRCASAIRARPPSARVRV